MGIVFFFWWGGGGACSILVPWPWIEPAPTTLRAKSLNPWATSKNLELLLTTKQFSKGFHQAELKEDCSICREMTRSRTEMKNWPWWDQVAARPPPCKGFRAQDVHHRSSRWRTALPPVGWTWPCCSPGLPRVPPDTAQPSLRGLGSSRPASPGLLLPSPTNPKQPSITDPMC